jgi:hypothetical protein
MKHWKKENTNNMNWKDIPGFVHYQVSDDGQIRRGNKLLSQFTKGIKPYLNVNLFYAPQKHKGVRVHRMVALAYIPNPENKPQVNHIDGNPKNNNVSNLEWCNASENVTHSYKLGLQIPFGKPKKLTPEIVRKIKIAIRSGHTQQKIADTFFISRALVAKIRDNKCWKNVA